MIITLCPFNTFPCAETKKGWQEGTNVMELWLDVMGNTTSYLGISLDSMASVFLPIMCHDYGCKTGRCFCGCHPCHTANFSLWMLFNPVY